MAKTVPPKDTNVCQEDADEQAANKWRVVSLADGNDCADAFLEGCRHKEKQMEGELAEWKDVANELELKKFSEPDREIAKQKNAEIARLRAALEHYESAHYDRQGNACCHDKTASEALAEYRGEK